MIVHPEIEALRGDDAPQRIAQERAIAAVRAWRGQAACAGVEDDFSHFARGVPLADLPALSALFDPSQGAARELGLGLVSLISGLMAKVAITQVPLRHQVDDAQASLVLMNAGGAVLMLQAINGEGLRRRGDPLSASFTPGMTFEHVLAGSAEAELITIAWERPGGVMLERQGFAVAPGDIYRREGAAQCLLLRRVAGTLVSLKLRRREISGAVMREYALSNGDLVHQAFGSGRDSRLELAAALLGAMGRKDAAPFLAAMAAEETSTALRWESLRQCLGLDSAIGFDALSRIAASADDPLCGPAGALRGQLLETYPQLAGASPCPA